jgi:hypothetical protein
MLQPLQNPNIEIRAKLPAGINTKQYQNPNVLNSKKALVLWVHVLVIDISII